MKSFNISTALVGGNCFQHVPTRASLNHRAGSLFEGLGQGLSSFLCGRRFQGCGGMVRAPTPVLWNSEQASYSMAASVQDFPSLLHHTPSSQPEGDSNFNISTTLLGIVMHHQKEFYISFDNLLEDRQTVYRDHLITSILQPHRMDLKRALLRLIKDSHSKRYKELLSSDEKVATKVQCGLCIEDINILREGWVRHGAIGGEGCIAGLGQPVRDAHDKGRGSLYVFYAALLSSALVTCDTEVRLILETMRTLDNLVPTKSTYEAIFRSLFLLDEATAHLGEGKARTGPAHASVDGQPSPKPQIIVGELSVLDRAAVGNLAGYYMGHYLAHHRLPDVVDPHMADNHLGLWGSFMELCTLAQLAPKLMNLWWGKMLDCCDAAISKHAWHCDNAGMALSTLECGTVKAPLPYQAVHAAIASCVLNHDIERCLVYFHEANARGLFYTSPLSNNIPGPASSAAMTQNFLSCGTLTEKSSQASVQLLQLRLLVKLMATAKSVKMDGGLKELIVRDVKRLIDSEVLFGAPFGVLNDFLSGLTVPSAMQLVKILSSRHQEGDGAVPFVIWSSLLRRCARDHHVDEAESLFFFLRKRFALTSPQKRELVEIMMRMHASLVPPDFSSTLTLFLDHVLRTPKNEPAVTADSILYNLLTKAADSRNASMMTFLEACAAGVGADSETFESLLSANSYNAVASLSQKLPYDYTSTALDTQLRIPANVDAHLRREEAQVARGKSPYDSTGDSF